MLHSPVDAVESIPLDCEVQKLVNIPWAECMEPGGLH
jgi:hypothetical protein